MSEINTGGPAFPRTGRVSSVGLVVEEPQRGMTLRQYAAIKLRVPNSGTDWLDEMIVQSLHDEFAAKAMQADMEILSAASLPDRNAEVARLSYILADAMLKAREA